MGNNQSIVTWSMETYRQRDCEAPIAHASSQNGELDTDMRQLEAGNATMEMPTLSSNERITNFTLLFILTRDLMRQLVEHIDAREETWADLQALRHDYQKVVDVSLAWCSKLQAVGTRAHGYVQHVRNLAQVLQRMSRGGNVFQNQLEAAQRAVLDVAKPLQAELQACSQGKEARNVLDGFREFQDKLQAVHDCYIKKEEGGGMDRKYKGVAILAGFGSLLSALGAAVAGIIHCFPAHGLCAAIVTAVGLPAVAVVGSAALAVGSVAGVTAVALATLPSHTNKQEKVNRELLVMVSDLEILVKNVQDKLQDFGDSAMLASNGAIYIPDQDDREAIADKNEKLNEQALCLARCLKDFKSILKVFDDPQRRSRTTVNRLLLKC